MDTTLYLKRMLVFLFIFSLSVFLPSQASATWTIDTVESSSVRNMGSMALDSQGRPHIVYGGNRLYHAFKDGGAWQEEMIDSGPGVGQYATITIDANDWIHIIYWDYGKNNQADTDPFSSICNDLRYATNAGGTWKVESLTPAHPLSLYSPYQIQVDASGRVHIVYLSGSFWGGDLIHYTGTFGNWQPSEVMAQDLWYSDFASCLSASGALHLFYRSGYDVVYRGWSGGLWGAAQVVDDNVQESFEPSLGNCTIDAEGFVHVLYRIWPHMRYATNQSGTWQAEIIEGVWNGGCFGVITTDAGGQVHVAYGGNDDCRNLRYAVGNFGSWNIETADNLDPAGRWDLGGLSMRLASSGDVHLTYIDTYLDDLKHAVKSAGTWSMEILNNNASEPSAFIDGNDQLHLHYYDTATAEITYALYSGGALASETMPSDNSNLASGGALATDTTGDIHIIYVDQDRNLIKYATGQSGQWQIGTVDNTEMSYDFKPFIEADSVGNAHIVYNNYDTSEVSYATNASGPWTVSPFLNECAYLSPVLVDGSDNVHFVIGDTTDSRLRIESIPGGEVQMEVNNLSGLYELKADAMGGLHFIYTVSDGGTHTLFHCTNAGATWQSEAIGSVDSELWAICLTLDGSGHVHIAFTLWDGSLNYATNATGSWEIAQDIAQDADPILLDMDSLGQAYVVWADNYDRQSLGCTFNTGTAWSTEIIDHTNSYFYYVNGAADDSGAAHLSYSDGGKAIKYAVGFPGTWSAEIIEDSIGYSWNDLTLDAMGNAHIAYREFRNLKYATTAFSGQQENEVEFPAYDGQSLITLESPEGTRIQSVEPMDNPSPVNTPGGVDFPYGFVKFEVTQVLAGGSIEVTMSLEPGASANTFYKYGPTPDDPSPHWYEFLYDGTTGAVISGNIITLYLVDGLRGDHDLTVNGVILEPGAPGVVEIQGDLDGDGDVDGADRNILIASLRKCNGNPAYNPDADFDDDGCVTFLDYRQWYIYYKNFVSDF